MPDWESIDPKLQEWTAEGLNPVEMCLAPGLGPQETPNDGGSPAQARAVCTATVEANDDRGASYT